MSRTKVFEVYIWRCFDCPRSWIEDLQDKPVVFCGSLKRVTATGNYTKAPIPDDCPLPDREPER